MALYDAEGVESRQRQRRCRDYSSPAPPLASTRSGSLCKGRCAQQQSACSTHAHVQTDRQAGTQTGRQARSELLIEPRAVPLLGLGHVAYGVPQSHATNGVHPAAVIDIGLERKEKEGG